MDREELIRILQQHPGIAKVTEEPLPADPNEVDSIVIHFDDGTVAHMNPGLASPLVPDETKDDQGVLQKLVDRGNTIVIIEHNLDVIKQADYIIDMGPEGGRGGGKVVVTGTPEEVAKNQESYTSPFIRKFFEGNKA